MNTKKAKKALKVEGDASPCDLYKARAVKRALEVQKIRKLAEKFPLGTRVNRSIWVKDTTNPLLLVKGYKSGTIIFNMVSEDSGYPTLLVLWDGDKTPVPEHPPLLTIEDW